jgi:IMP dehydrogenase
MSKLERAKEAFTFDDFILVPNHSTIKSRKDPDISVNLPGLSLSSAMISAPMNTITEKNMILAMAEEGASSVLHRFMSLEEQLFISKVAIDRGIDNFWVAVGATKDYLERVLELKKIGVNNFCVDVANGHSEICVSAVKSIMQKISNVNIFAGNVCTAEGAYRLAEVGASVIRIGIGPGSMCSTRIVTGHGLPQLSAIEECASIKKQFPQVAIVADGGIRSSGDITKALAIGADAVMIGSLLKATTETPGEIIEEGGKLYKYYSGMASEEGRANWFDVNETGFVPEGVSAKVLYENKSVKDVMKKIIGGLKVGMSYAGASNIKELQEKTQWRRVTQAGQIEGTPHGKR